MQILGQSCTRSQIIDGALNLTRNEAQQKRCRGWFDYSGFVDRYTKREAHVVLCIRSGKGQDYLALIQREGGGRFCADYAVGDREALKVSKPIELRLRDLTFAWSQGTAGWRKTHGQQKSMFVDDVEFVELPEQVAETSSLVWLDTVENISARLPRALYTSVRKTKIVIGTIPDWEVRVLYGFLGSGSHNSMSQMIERATEIVEGVAQNQVDCLRDDGELLDVINCVARLFIDFSADTVTVGIPEEIDGRLEIRDVLLGPLVFC